MKTWDKNLPLLSALVLLFIYLSPDIIFPTHAHFLIHDNLDSEVGWYKMITESGLTFSSNTSIFPNLFNGIPRGCMPTELDFYTILNLIFSPLAAYCILIVLQHLIAFFSMRLLLTDYIFKGEYPYHTALLSLAFALLPFWPMGEFCIAGQPIVIWALLNLFHNKKFLYNWAILILFPFCSSDFVFSNLFFLPGLLAGILILFYIYKRKNITIILGWCVLFSLSVASEYRLILLQFTAGFISQRNGYAVGPFLNWKGYLKDIFLFMGKGQYHFYSCQFPVIIATLFFSLFLIRSKKYYGLLSVPFFFVFLFSIIDTFHVWNASVPVLKKLGTLSSLQFRFVTWLPVIWLMVFATCVYFILKQNKRFYWLTLSIVILQIIFLFFNINNSDFQDSKYAENAFYYTYINRDDRDHKSFNTYFAPKLFSQLKKDLNYKQETVLCIGFPAELAQFSGIHSAAAYLDYYPAEKKEQLINIFRPDLDKITDSVKRQNIIGSRRFQYYSAQFTDSSKTSFDLNLDTMALKKMDIKYVMSRKRIKNYDSIHLKIVDSVTNENRTAPRRLFVYEVN